MKRIFSEPTVHFLLIAGSIFLAYLFVETRRQDDNLQIVVTNEQIQQLTDQFESIWSRPPSKDELTHLVDDFVLDEAYYREARKLRLDRNDPVIRNRLRLTLEMMTDDLMLVEPSDSDLAAYLTKNEDRFQLPSVYSFRQMYFNPEKHGERPEAAVASKLALLRRGENIEGDPTLLQEEFRESSTEDIDAVMGRKFASQLANLEIGTWQGPIRSGFGFHLVRIDSRVEGRLPTLDEVRPAVAREWNNERRTANREQINERLLQEYNVTIEWPEQPGMTRDIGDRSKTPVKKE